LRRPWDGSLEAHMKTQRWLKDRTRTSHRVGEESGRRNTENAIKKSVQKAYYGGG